MTGEQLFLYFTLIVKVLILIFCITQIIKLIKTHDRKL
jgi:hypothetical protein